MRELAISLKPGDRLPLYEQIYAYIKREIREGSIKAGEKLPSSRALSAFLEVSRSTVDLAYAQLLSEGYVESEPCRGYYACQIEDLYCLSADTETKAPVQTEKEKGYDYDFTPNGIDLNSFPYGTWRKITRNILLDDNKELFQLGDPKGEWELRETICSYLHHARGVSCQPEQVILGAGNDYLLLLLSALLGTDHRIAMETPTYKHAWRIFEQLGFSLSAVPVDAQGMEVNGLEASAADIAYVMPSHQYPLGIVMPIKRRLELLAWAAQRDGRYLIEDDYDSEFRYRGKPIPALQGTDKKGSVIYIGTFSKSIAPAIRVSYMVLPWKLLEVYEKKIGLFSSTVSRIDQMILNSFLKDGFYERHLNRMRGIYGRKHDVLLNGLKSLSGICHIRGENAGVHLLAEFGDGRTEEELVKRAEEERVKVYPLSGYCLEDTWGQSFDRKTGPAVILGYATLTEGEIELAAQRLVRAWGTGQERR